jgi:hypothetical protein
VAAAAADDDDDDEEVTGKRLQRADVRGHLHESKTSDFLSELGTDVIILKIFSQQLKFFNSKFSYLGRNNNIVFFKKNANFFGEICQNRLNM